MDIDNKTLVKILDFIGDEYEYELPKLKTVARYLRIQKYGLKDIDGEFHFVEED